MIAGNFNWRDEADAEPPCVLRFKAVKGRGLRLEIEFGKLGGGRLAAVRENLKIFISQDEAAKLLKILKSQIGGER